jgi:hypothetical protein
MDRHLELVVRRRAAQSCSQKSFCQRPRTGDRDETMRVKIDVRAALTFSSNNADEVGSASGTRER